jgi:TetR/AcrR family transcriptional regulator
MAWKNAVASRQEQRELKREALLREAAAAFNQNGYHATSLDDIANSLGVSKAALYYYYPNKQKLLAACLERLMEASFQGLSRAIAEGKNGREKIKLALEYYLLSLIDEMSCCVIVMEDDALLPEDHQEHIKVRDRYEQALRDLVREGIADGSIVPCDPKIVTLTFLGSVHWVPKWFSHDRQWSGKELATMMCTLLDRALSTAPVKSLLG